MAITTNIILAKSTAKKLRRRLRIARDFTWAMHTACKILMDQACDLGATAAREFAANAMEELDAAQQLLKQAIRDSEE